MTTYVIQDCQKRYPEVTIVFDGTLDPFKLYKFNSGDPEWDSNVCYNILRAGDGDGAGIDVTIKKSYDDCPCTEPAEVITEDDVNLKVYRYMAVNEKLLGVKCSIVITNGIETHKLFSYSIPFPQVYVAGFLDYNDEIVMPWAVNFPEPAYNNKARISTGSGFMEIVFPNIINWRYFQAMPQLASIFGVNATNNWLWYQQNGWSVKFLIEMQNEIGVYQDFYPFYIRDYDDNPDVDWTWGFYRVSDNVQVSAPISTEPVRVVVTTTQPAPPPALQVDASTITVEGIEKPIRWLISSAYAHTGQATSPLQPLPTETQLLFTADPFGTVAEFIFDPSKVQGQDGVKFTARNYRFGSYPLNTERNVIEFPIAKLPPEKLKDEYESDCCDCLPELKLASFTSEELIHNDITGFAHKNQTAGDTCEFKIFKGGQLIANNGVDYPNGFPHDPKVSAFIWNWKWYLVNHGQGCYKIEKHYTVAGLPLVEELSVYNLLEYTPENAKGTARVLYQNNFQTLWDENTINYTDSGFEDSYRFRGMFGNWQPNVMSESNFSVSNENRVASIKSKDTYILNHFHATECHIKRLHKIVMHATIWRMSDHNPSNTLQEKKIYECVLGPESKEQIDYTAGSRVTGIEVILSKRQQNSVSLFGGSVQVPEGVTWLLPTVTGGGGGCPNGTVTITDNNDNVIGTQSVASGGVATFKVTDLPCVIPPDTERWKIRFKDTNDVNAIDVASGDIYTFTSGSGANIGTMSVSTDGITYTPISYPYTPTLGMNYYKRGTKLVTATYTMI